MRNYLPMFWRSFFAVVIFTVGITHNAFAANDQFYWFREDVPCEEYKVAVRSYCADEPDYPVNNRCSSAQELLIEKPGEAVRNVALSLRRNNREGLRAGSFLCRRDKNKQMNLVIVFDNGGNCAECESAEILRLDGKWLTAGKRNFGKVADKLGLPLTPWPGGSFLYLKNKNREVGESKHD